MSEDFSSVASEPWQEPGLRASEPPHEEAEEETLARKEEWVEGEEEAEQEPQEKAPGGEPMAQYFRELYRVPLLSREREVELAKQMEAGNARVKEAVFSSRVALSFALDLGKRLERGEAGLRGLERSPEEEGERRAERFVKGTASLRRLSRSWDRISARLAGRIGAKERRRLEQSLWKKRAEVARNLEGLDLSEQAVSEIAGRLKQMSERLGRLEREGGAPGEIRAIEREAGMAAGEVQGLGACRRKF